MDKEKAIEIIQKMTYTEFYDLVSKIVEDVKQIEIKREKENKKREYCKNYMKTRYQNDENYRELCKKRYNRKTYNCKTCNLRVKHGNNCKNCDKTFSPV
jgi:hypothetical protein